MAFGPIVLAAFLLALINTLISEMSPFCSGKPVCLLLTELVLVLKEYNIWHHNEKIQLAQGTEKIEDK